MIRQARLIAVVGAFLIAVVVVGCGSGPGNIDERGDERGAAATDEETTAPKGDRSAARTAQELVGFDEEVVSPPGQANRPVAFGEGSLWATDAFGPGTGCDDVIGDSASASASASSEASCGGGVPIKTLLKRVDPRTGEVVAAIPLEAVIGGEVSEVAGGAGSVWVSLGGEYTDPRPTRWPGDLVLRVDPRTNRVVDRILVDTPTALDFGYGSVWVTSATFGTLSRIDPQTGEVVAKIDVDRGAVDVAVDENSGAVWVAGLSWNTKPENNKLSRVDPETNRVVAEIPIRADSRDGGASSVAVGEGAVWVLSIDGKLLKVDPETNEVAGMVSIGAASWLYPLVVYRGGVWAMAQNGGIHLVRVDPRTMHVVAYKDLKPFNIVAVTLGLAAGGGYVWFSSGEGLARVVP